MNGCHETTELCAPTFCDELATTPALTALEAKVAEVGTAVSAASTTIAALANPDPRIDAAAVAMLQEAGWSVTVLDQAMDLPAVALSVQAQLDPYDPPADQLVQAHDLVVEVAESQESKHSVVRMGDTVVSEMVGTPVGHHLVLLGSRVRQTQPLQ